MKTCAKCGDTKPLDEFYADRRTKDGRQSYCKRCFLDRKSEYQADYQKQNPDKVNEWNRRSKANSGDAGRKRRSFRQSVWRAKKNWRIWFETHTKPHSNKLAPAQYQALQEVLEEMSK